MKLTMLIAALCLTTTAWAKQPSTPQDFKVKSTTDTPAKRDFLKGFVSFSDFIGKKQSQRPMAVRNLFDCAQNNTLMRFGMVRSVSQEKIVAMVNAQIEEMNKAPDTIPEGFEMDHLSMRVQTVLNSIMSYDSRNSCQSLIEESRAAGATEDMIDEALAYGDGLGILSALYQMGFRL